MSWINPIDVALYLTVGAILGALYFLLLFRTVGQHVARAAAARIIPLYILRLAAAVSIFWITAQQGVFPLVLTLVGFIVARTATLRWMESE